jgi:hypothetical protein
MTTIKQARSKAGGGFVMSRRFFRRNESEPGNSVMILCTTGPRTFDSPRKGSTRAKRTKIAGKRINRLKYEIAAASRGTS